MYGIFREDNGNWSMTRMLPFIVVLSMMVVYVYVGLSTKTIPTLDFNGVVLIIGLTTGKVVQKALEQKDASVNPTKP